jgi:hypothetical protein
LLDALYSVLADLLELTGRADADNVGKPSNVGNPTMRDLQKKDIRILLRNPGINKELKELAALVDTAWVARAVRGVDKLSSGQRRNINRQLALDSLGLSLAAR